MSTTGYVRRWGIQQRTPFVPWTRRDGLRKKGNGMEAPRREGETENALWKKIVAVRTLKISRFDQDVGEC
jgi:hypothetical protein